MEEGGREGGREREGGKEGKSTPTKGKTTHTEMSKLV